MVRRIGFIQVVSRSLFRFIAAVALLNATGTVAAAEDEKISIGHIAVLTQDADKAAGFLNDAFGWKRLEVPLKVSPEKSAIGEMELVFIDANGFWLELVQPRGGGPAANALKARGNGSFAELAFEVPHYDKLLKRMKSAGHAMLGMDGSPVGKTKGYLTQTIGNEPASRPIGIKIAYWPTSLSRGTSVEAYDPATDGNDNIIDVRKKARGNVTTDTALPRVDRVAIIVSDLEKAADFYVKHLGLKRHPLKIELGGETNERSGGMIGTFIDANGIWLALVQPVGPGPIQDYIDQKGDGAIAELIVEVNDLSAYYDRMKSRGIQLVDTRGQPLDENEKAHVLEPYEDRIAYLPTDVSHGMVIELFQRGPEATSLLHMRDKNWPYPVPAKSDVK